MNKQVSNRRGQVLCSAMDETKSSWRQLNATKTYSRDFQKDPQQADLMLQ